VARLIIADNVVRRGAVIDPASRDANVIGVRTFLELVSKSPVSATACKRWKQDIWVCDLEWLPAIDERAADHEFKPLCSMTICDRKLALPRIRP